MGPNLESPPANVRPPGLKHVGIEQHLKQQIPPDLVFRDERGKPVRLGDYFGQRPMILNLVYYKCPMLCSEVLSGLVSALKPLKLTMGKDFDVLTISFDPRETPQDASGSKATWLKRYAHPGAEKGWHFLTGPQAAIDRLTGAAGFGYDYDEKTGQFAHSTAILVLTSEGTIAQYYYGVEFSPKDLRLGLVDSSKGKIGNLTDQVLLYCYHYDPNAGRYSVLVLRLLRAAGVLTMVLLGGFMALMFHRERRGEKQEARRAE
ncbi:MAG: SCO family protein [Acidobacteria bacterium]|nr:SCO family protein [Acidobacteriota bacterium]